MSDDKKKKINLALQGGGAHGAFTWGILDRFLEKDLFDIEGISSTSAGSMNAVILAQGLMEGGNDGARQLLYNFWHAMSLSAEASGLTLFTQLDAWSAAYSKVPLSFNFFSTMMNLFSPYEFNPFNINPLRQVLENLIDIEKIKRESKLKLFICSTNVRTGKIRIFNEEELSIDAILASACLPKLFQAVKVDDDYYWDGGYLGNPAIFPLIYDTKTRDILILHVVPIVRNEIPQTVIEIDSRLREVSFNSSLMREMRAIAFVSKLIENDWIKPEYKDKLKKLNVHCLRADHALKEFPMASVYLPKWDFLLQLRDLGRTAADEWLDKHYHAIGRKSTVDFAEWL